MFKQFMEVFAVIAVMVATFFICKGVSQFVIANIP